MQKFLATNLALLTTLFVSLSTSGLQANQTSLSLRSNVEVEQLLETMDPEDKTTFIALLEEMSHDSQSNKAFADKIFDKVGFYINAFPYSKVPGFTLKLVLAVFFWEYGNQIADKIFPNNLTTSKSEFIKLLMGVLLIDDIKEFIKAIKNLDKEEKPKEITIEEIKLLLDNALKELHSPIKETPQLVAVAA